MTSAASSKSVSPPAPPGKAASIFESIRLSEEQVGKPEPIQKIISAPLSVEGKATGVIQVCRKGSDPAKTGPNFSMDELNALAEISKSIARYI